VLAAVDGVLGWLVPISAIVALVFVVLTFLARPERAPLLRTLGIGLVALAALAIVFSYVIPKFLPPVLDESPWARVPARMADDSLGLTLFASFVLAAAGLVLFLASTRMGRTKRWSTPVSTYRYREERSWS
jgi:branched-subunit amino acid ABC-type transport system permease component